MLIQSSSTLIKDLYLAVKPQAAENERQIQRFSTATTLIISAFLVIAAINPPEMLIWLNLLSLGGLEATFLWVIVLGLFWKKANATGAICSMVVGLTSYVLIASLGIKIFSFHAIVPSLVLGLAAFLVGNLFGERK